MFTYRLHLAGGSDVGEATYLEHVKIGEEVFRFAAFFQGWCNARRRDPGDRDGLRARQLGASRT
jgi:hypothetical protein